MSESRLQSEYTSTEERLMRMEVPKWYTHEAPRMCLLQLQAAETAHNETSIRRNELIEASYWDYEDYDEAKLGARPEGTDPGADVLVCGIGSWTVRIFQAHDGGVIKTGNCKADNYCLKQRFLSVGTAPSIEEGRALYTDIIDTCDGAINKYNAGNYCPRLDCGLSAGVSVDQVPGTAGTCAVEG